jgi:hypothetical protein
MQEFTQNADLLLRMGGVWVCFVFFAVLFRRIKDRGSLSIKDREEAANLLVFTFWVPLGLISLFLIWFVESVSWWLRYGRWPI